MEILGYAIFVPFMWRDENGKTARKLYYYGRSHKKDLVKNCIAVPLTKETMNLSTISLRGPIRRMIEDKAWQSYNCVKQKPADNYIENISIAWEVFTHVRDVTYSCKTSEELLETYGHVL
jgi:hypothetical protein